MNPHQQIHIKIFHGESFPVIVASQGQHCARYRRIHIDLRQLQSFKPFGLYRYGAVTLVTPYSFWPFALADTGRSGYWLLHQRRGQNPMNI